MVATWQLRPYRSCHAAASRLQFAGQTIASKRRVQSNTRTTGSWAGVELARKNVWSCREHRRSVDMLGNLCSSDHAHIVKQAHKYIVTKRKPLRNPLPVIKSDGRQAVLLSCLGNALLSSCINCFLSLSLSLPLISHFHRVVCSLFNQLWKCI